MNVARSLNGISISGIPLAPVVALAAGRMSGVFLAFSNFVMPALARGAAMQASNDARAAASFALVLLLTLGCSPNALHGIAPPGSQVEAERLSQLGVFQGELKLQRPQAGFVPYDVNVASYSGDASKRRFVYLPPGSRIHTHADRWELPVGSYLVKTFSLGERLIETRILAKTASGLRAATYVWNAEQTDALASPGDLDVPVSFTDDSGSQRQQLVHVPSADECDNCHAGRALGWRSRQLDISDQIERFAALGLIDRAPPAHALLANPFGDAPLALRARSYLDANCSHCHGAGGRAEETGLLWDLEHTESGRLPSCRETLAIEGRDRVLVPGHPEQSAFLSRMLSADPALHMPRGATGAPDRRAVELLSAWVAALPERSCH